MLPDSNNRYKPQGYTVVNNSAPINNEESSSVFFDSNTRNGNRRKPLHRLCKFVDQIQFQFVYFRPKPNTIFLL